MKRWSLDNFSHPRLRMTISGNIDHLKIEYYVAGKQIYDTKTKPLYKNRRHMFYRSVMKRCTPLDSWHSPRP